MFRLQNNLPNVYVSESRDFQLLCRLYDVVNNGVRFDIKSMTNLLDANNCQDSTLDLLATRKGLFTNKNFDSKLYRSLLDGFPYIQKYKGSKLGIEMVISLILRLDGLLNDAVVEVAKNNVIITTNQPIINKLALDTLLSYVLPIGMKYKLVVVKDLQATNTSEIEQKDIIKLRKYASSTTNSNISDLNTLNPTAYTAKTVSIISNDVTSNTPTTVTITSNGNEVTSAATYNTLIDDKIKSNVITIKTNLEPDNKYDRTISSSEIIGSENYTTTNSSIDKYKIEQNMISEETDG